MRWPTLAVATLLLLPVQSLVAQECPTARDGKRGFVAERGDNQKSEIFHLDDGAVRLVMRYGGVTQLEATQFEGLFQLERIARGRRTVNKPQTDLAPLFPLQPGRDVAVRFDQVYEAGRVKTPIAVTMTVSASDPIYVGSCRYDVLKIDEHEARGDYPARHISTNYYSPELKLVLMREYLDGTGRINTFKYDRVYPIK
jgi:hypothetical protein